MFLMVQFILISKKCGIWDLVEADTKVNFIIASNKYLTTIQYNYHKKESHSHCKNKCVILAKYFATTIVHDYPSLHKLM